MFTIFLLRATTSTTTASYFLLTIFLLLATTTTATASYVLLTIFLLGSCMVKLTLEGKAPAQKDVSRPE